MQDGKPIFWIRQHDLVNNLEKLALSLSNNLDFQLKNLTVEMIDEYDLMIDATGSRMQLAKKCEKLGLGNLIVDDAGSFNHYSTYKYKSKKINNGIWIGNNGNEVVYVESDNGEITITTDAENLTKNSLPIFFKSYLMKNQLLPIIMVPLVFVAHFGADTPSCESAMRLINFPHKQDLALLLFLNKG